MDPLTGKPDDDQDQNPTPPQGDEGAPPADTSAPDQDADAAGGDVGDDDAGSPPADDVKGEPKTALDAVLQALDKGKGKPAESSAAAGKKEGDDTDGGGEDAVLTDADIAEMQNLHFGKHPRFRALLKERKTLLKRQEAITQERDDALAHSQAAASEVQNFRTFKQTCQQQGIGAEDVNAAFTFMTLMRKNPREALRIGRAVIADLEQETGDALPDDLKDRVEKGELDEPSALEISQERAKRRLAENQTHQAVETVQTTAQQQELARIGRAMQEVKAEMASWEDGWKKSDPDFAKKHPLLIMRVKEVATAKPPTTALEAREMAESALKWVNDYLRTVQPKKQTVTPIRGGTPPARTVAVAKTPQEVVDQALARSG